MSKEYRAQHMSLVARTPLEFAAEEIANSYGNVTSIKRKSLHKFGRCEVVGTTEIDINYLGIDPVHSHTNSITHFSSTNAADTQTLRVEGMIIASGVMLFQAQDITLNGQTKTALSIPLCRVTRIANVSSTTATLGDVYVYEDGTVSGGIPTDLNTVGNVMPATEQSTLFAGTSISGTNYFVCTGYYAYMNKKTTAQADIRFKIKPEYAEFYRSISVSSISNASAVNVKFDPYLIIPTNHDIDMTAVASTTGVDITAGFSGYFADIIWT